MKNKKIMKQCGYCRIGNLEDPSKVEEYGKHFENDYYSIDFVDEYDADEIVNNIKDVNDQKVDLSTLHRIDDLKKVTKKVIEKLNPLICIIDARYQKIPGEEENEFVLIKIIPKAYKYFIIELPKDKDIYWVLYTYCGCCIKAMDETNDIDSLIDNIKDLIEKEL